MMNPLLLGAVGLLAVVFLLQLVLLLRKDKTVQHALAALSDKSSELEQIIQAELAKVIAEAQAFRTDVTERISGVMKLMVPASTVTRSIDEKLDRVREVVEQRLTALQEDHAQRFDKVGEKSVAVADGQRQDSIQAIEKIKQSIFTLLDQYTKYQNQSLHQALTDQTAQQRTNLAAMVEHLTRLIEASEQKLTMFRAEADARMKRIQAEVAVVAKFSAATHAFGAALATEFNGAHETQQIPSR